MEQQPSNDSNDLVMQPPNYREESKLLRQVSDLIAPGSGGQRIFRLLIPGACRFECDFCPARAQRFLPNAWKEPSRLLRIFLLAFRQGWCDGLFLMAGIARSPVFAMEKLLETVETLRITYGYRGYLHVKAPEGADPRQVERLLRLVDRVSYRLDPACQRAVDKPQAAVRPAKPLLREMSPKQPRVAPRAPRLIGLQSAAPPGGNRQPALFEPEGLTRSNVRVSTAGSGRFRVQSGRT